jgi:hypothetical protein
MTAVAASGLPLERGDSSAVGRGRGRAGRPAGPTTITARLSPRYEGKTAVIEPLMVGGKTPEIC